MCREPTDLEIAMWERRGLSLVGFGPLTKEEAEREASYIAYCEESQAEHEAEMAAGGRTICPQCGRRTVKHRTVLTYGVPGHPGSEYSDMSECENCDYKDL